MTTTEPEKKSKPGPRKAVRCTVGIRLTFTDELLGTLPAEEDIFQTHVAPDFPEDAQNLPSPESLAEALEEGTSVFYRDSEAKPSLRDYQLKGFFKAACGALRRVPGTPASAVTAYKQVLNTLVFINPKFLPLVLPEGQQLGHLSRPIRILDRTGERTALVRSEMAPIGTSVECHIIMLHDGLWPVIRSLLDYGSLYGIGQWRNSGAGRFTWEMLKAEQ